MRVTHLASKRELGIDVEGFPRSENTFTLLFKGAPSLLVPPRRLIVYVWYFFFLFRISLHQRALSCGDIWSTISWTVGKKGQIARRVLLPWNTWGRVLGAFLAASLFYLDVCVTNAASFFFSLYVKKSSWAEVKIKITFLNNFDSYIYIYIFFFFLTFIY